MSNYTIQLSSTPIDLTEKTIFDHHLQQLGMNATIWSIYEKFLQNTSDDSKPQIARIKKDDKLIACLFFIECKDYGSSLSKSKFINALIKKLPISVHMWMRAGIASEIFANPLFMAKSIVGHPKELNKILHLIRKKFFLLFTHDLTDHALLHQESVIMTYPDEGIIHTGNYKTHQDYYSEHRSLKRKLQEYRKVKGRIDIIKGVMDKEMIAKTKECAIVTAKKSVFNLPYQKDYPAMCEAAARIDGQHLVHFICRSDEVFYGYHSFAVFENQLRCLTGAFNRGLPTTHHAYENMIYKVVEYAIENNIQTIYFGAILNETKKRMMNHFIPTKIYVSSNFPFLLKLFTPILRNSRLSTKNLLKYSEIKKKTAQ